MAHLSPVLRQRFLARALSHEEALAVVEHFRVCPSCRENLIILREKKPGSLVEQILPLDEHPPDDFLAAYVDDDLNVTDRRSVEKHLSGCELCRQNLDDLRQFRTELLELPSRQHRPANPAMRAKMLRDRV